MLPSHGRSRQFKSAIAHVPPCAGEHPLSVGRVIKWFPPRDPNSSEEFCLHTLKLIARCFVDVSLRIFSAITSNGSVCFGVGSGKFYFYQDSPIIHTVGGGSNAPLPFNRVEGTAPIFWFLRAYSGMVLNFSPVSWGNAVCVVSGLYHFPPGRRDRSILRV